MTTTIRRLICPFTCGDSILRDYFSGYPLDSQFSYRGFVLVNGSDLFYTYRDSAGDRCWEYRGARRG